MDFIEKLDFLMERYELNKRSLSKKSEIPYTTIDNWYKRGYENLTLPTLRKLAQYFNTTLDFWFLDEVTDPNYGKTSGFKVEYDEMEHIKKYRSLDPHGKKMVDFILNEEFERSKIASKENGALSENNLSNSKIRLINYYYRLASAGTGQIVFDLPPAERIEIPDIPKYKKVDYAIGVNGNSMEPVFHDGDILLIEMTDEIQIDEIGIFLVDGESYVKKLGNEELLSLNPEYGNIQLTENSKCMGKVIDKL